MTTGSEATTLALGSAGRTRGGRVWSSSTARTTATLMPSSVTPPMQRLPGQCAPVAPGIPEAYTRPIVLPYDEEASLVYIEQHHHEITCIFCEAIQNRNPAAVLADFLRRLRAPVGSRHRARV